MKAPQENADDRLIGELHQTISNLGEKVISLQTVTECLRELYSLFDATSKCKDLNLGNSTILQPDLLVATAKEIRSKYGVPESLLDKLCDKGFVRRHKTGASRQAAKLHMVEDVLSAVRALLSRKKPVRKSGKKKK